MSTPATNLTSYLSDNWSTGTLHFSRRGLILARTDSVTLVSSTITSNRSPTSSFTILDRVSTTPDIHLPPAWERALVRKRYGDNMLVKQAIHIGQPHGGWSV